MNENRTWSRSVWALLMGLFVVGCWPLAAAHAQDVDTIRKALNESDSPPLDLKQYGDPADLAKLPYGKELAEWAAKDNADIPQVTYTQYRTFQRTGDRDSFQRPFFAKRKRLTQHVLAVWLLGQDDRMDRVNDFVWSICEETSWILPAHESSNKYTDLGAAETASELAFTVYLLGDKMPREVRDRVYQEVNRRVITPYIEHPHAQWWWAGRNNWTAVCAGSIGEAVLLLEPDVDRQAVALAQVVDQLNRYIDHAFAPDGGCLEGVGYWNYGLCHFVGCAELLQARTKGRIDLLGQPKIAKIARYPLAVSLGPGAFASFSDAHEAGWLAPFIAVKMAERGNAPGLLGLTRGGPSWRVGEDLFDLIWWGGKKREAPPLHDELLPESGIAKLVGTAAGKQSILVAKAGTNGESHNHNDVGSFIFRVDGETYLTDPGAGLYNRDYFSSKRYENVFANSYGHSVPRIGGHLQQPGSHHKGTLSRGKGEALRIEFDKAYANPELSRAERTLALTQDGMDYRSDYAFKGAGLAVEEAFITWLPVQVHDNIARIQSDRGSVEMTADEGTFQSERLEEACKANHKHGVLTRITLAYPAASKRAVHVAMRYLPGK